MSTEEANEDSSPKSQNWQKKNPQKALILYHLI